MRIEADAAARAVIKALGLPPDEYSVTDETVIAAALRRVLTIHLGISRISLISEVAEPFFSLIGQEYSDAEDPMHRLRNHILGILEDLTSIGDILEVTEVDESRLIQQRTMYYPAHPSFVIRGNGDILLLSTLPGYHSPIPSDMQHLVEHRKLLRVIPGSAGPGMAEILKTFGLREILGSVWTDSPPSEVAGSYLDRFDRELASRNLEGNLKPSQILAGGNVTYYKGRWRAIKTADKGRYIGRIPQPYGSPAWAYLDIKDGRVLRSRFFPTPGSRYRAFEEAWRLQSAIDSVGGNPQKISAKRISETETEINIFSPIPSWLDRRWVLLADKGRGKGSFATYKFSTTDVDEEIEFAKIMFWLEVK